MAPPRISASILTFNEESNIARCLASVAWADEVVVVDSGSSDRTVELARSMSARVIVRPWEGFRVQRAASFDACTGDWILFLDADEWVPDDLAAEIRQTISAGPRESGFEISRRNLFLERWIDHAWAPDRVLRLFRRGLGRLEGYEPHVHLTLPEGHALGRLSRQLHHAAYDSISELLVKVNRYSSVFADADETDRLYAPWKMIASPLASAFKTYLLKGGFREGVHGLVIAWATAHYHFLKYAKKWEKLRRSRVAASAPLRDLGGPVATGPGVASEDEHGRS